MSKECVRKHFATRGKYQDTAMLSIQSGEAAALTGFVVLSDGLACFTKYSSEYYAIRALS
jgi:hypothetical protein